MSIDTARCDAICGLDNIARALGLTRARARSLLTTGTLPSFDREGEVCVRRSVLAQRLRLDQDRAARRARRR